MIDRPSASFAAGSLGALVVALAFLVSPAQPSAAEEQNGGGSNGEQDSRAHEESEASASDGAEGVAMPNLEAPADATAPFRLSLGPLAATRNLSFEGESGEITHRPPPYFGGQIEASGAVKRFESPAATLRLHTDLGYAVSKSDGSPAPAGRELTTELIFGGARLFVFRELANRFHLGVGAGFQATSVILQPNPTYTGHRYLAAETGLRFRWRMVPGLLTLVTDAVAHPVFATTNSYGAHGPGRAFGGRAGGELAWRFASAAEQSGFRRLRLVAGYRYQRYRSQFPRSSLGPKGGTAIDNHHIATLGLEFTIPTSGGN